MDFVSLAARPDDGDEPDGWFDHGRSFAPPDNRVAPVVGSGQVLIRSDDVALLLTGVAVYPEGIQIGLEVRQRTSDTTAHLQTWETIQRTVLGAELADGTRVVSTAAFGAEPPTAAAGDHRLVSSGAGGGGRSFAMTYWLTPAPPPGDLELVVLCPLVGPVEARHTVAGAMLADSAARGLELWPWEPDVQAPTDPVPPEVPPGGWFAETLG